MINIFLSNKRSSRSLWLFEWAGWIVIDIGGNRGWSMRSRLEGEGSLQHDWGARVKRWSGKVSDARRCKMQAKR